MVISLVVALLSVALVSRAAPAGDRIIFHNGKTLDCRVITFSQGVFLCEVQGGLTNRVASGEVKEVVFDAPDQPPTGEPKGGPVKAWEEEVELIALVDDGCELYLNGDPVVFVPGKAQMLRVREGDVLAVKAWDTQGGTAGGLALALTRKNGKALVTDTQWLTSPKLESQWNTKPFNDKTWRHARKSALKWLEDAVQKQFKERRKPMCIWGHSGNVYFRKTIRSADFQ